MREIVVATKNQGKVREIEAMLAHLNVKVLDLGLWPDIPEAVEDGATFADNALLKARHYAELTGKPCLADDSGLEVDALQGAPGVYSARYAGPAATDAQNNAKLLAALSGVPTAERTGRFRCVLAFVDGKQAPLTADGSCEGVMLTAEEGDGGFGYDPLFYVPSLGKTLAAVSMEEKNAISHRGKALRAMADKLAGYWS